MMAVVPSAKALSAAVLSAQTEQNPFGWFGIETLLESELEPPRWVVPALEIGPGRPCGLWGYGGTGKSYVAMAMALAVASGRDLFGRFEVRRGIVCHVSHELGRRVLMERYRRLANGELIEPGELRGRLKVSAYPKIKLSDSAAEEAYKREFEGVDLVVLDSLRRALPGVDENDSTIGQYLDLLARVSDATACTFLVLHHSGKGGLDGKRGQESDDRASAGRGSSSIYDGSGAVWLVKGAGRGPRQLAQIRAHDDGDGINTVYHVDLVTRAVEPLYAASRGALRIELLDDGDLEKRRLRAERKRNEEQAERDTTRILEAVRELGNQAFLRRILQLVGDGRGRRTLLDDLVADGKLELVDSPTRGGTAKVYRVVEQPDHPADELGSDWYEDRYED